MAEGTVAEVPVAEFNPPLLEFLGDAEPLAVLADTESALRVATLDLRVSELKVPEAPGKWSVTEVVQHLADCEITFGYRCREVLSTDGSALSALDADAWAAGLRYRDRVLEDALNEFSAGRCANLRVLNQTTLEERRTRYGIHAERGRESLEKIIRIWAAHDLSHLAQIARIKAVIRTIE